MIKLDEQNLYIYNQIINYNDIDCLVINVPQKSTNFCRTNSKTHYITIFTTIDIPIKIAIDLSNEQSKELVDAIKKHIKDCIIEYYDAGIFATD